jgi:glycosyltransferase involved in cell wall biosynthesis
MALVLSCSTIPVAKRHGLEVVIRALTNLREEIKEIKFQIIGEGDYIHSIKDLIRDLSLEDYVDLKGDTSPGRISSGNPASGYRSRAYLL